MRIALAQINSHLGHFQSNYDKIINYINKAKALRCDVVLFSEAALFGYHPMDLLERSTIVDAQSKFLKKLEKKIPANITVVVGAFSKNPSPLGKRYFNSAYVIHKGKKSWSCHKELLPTYDVFDDARHIERGDIKKNVVNILGKKVLITICEDIWAWPPSGETRSLYEVNPIKKIKPGSVDLVLNLSASPFHQGKMKARLHTARATVKYLKAPLVYVNMVGGQDELIFDGGSFALNGKGEICAQSAQFNEDINVVDFTRREGGMRVIAKLNNEQLRQALVLGLRDFVDKNQIRQVHLGLSGGIDSALVACLAVDALGPSRVATYALPGPYSSADSLKWAKKLAKNIGVAFHDIEIVTVYKKLIQLLAKEFGKFAFGITHENIQARIRAIILMAISNQKSSLLLNTSNKCELAAGYGTMYGDLVGGLSPIGDLLKGDIYSLARHYNADHELIPREIILRAPSAELRPNQKDQDTLPPYKELDQSVVNLVEKFKLAKSKTDLFLLKALMGSEFKRWQSPPILKVREHSFGRGRRMPIAHAAIY